MQLTKILITMNLCLAYSSVRAETLYFGDSYRMVELRDDAPTLLLFPAPALATACQPANAFSFESMTGSGLSLMERTQLQMETSKKKNEPIPSKIKRMLRINPLKAGASASCSISLASGHEVGVNFKVARGLSKPFIEFKSIDDAESDQASLNEGLDLLRSSVLGQSVKTILNIRTGSARDRRSIQRRRSKTRFTTEKASYSLSYAGETASYSIWKFKVTTKKISSFDKLSALDVSTPGTIFYSALFPQNQTYNVGEKALHHIVARKDMSLDEIVEALP